MSSSVRWAVSFAALAMAGFCGAAPVDAVPGQEPKPRTWCCPERPLSIFNLDSTHYTAE